MLDCKQEKNLVSMDEWMADSATGWFARAARWFHAFWQQLQTWWSWQFSRKAVAADPASCSSPPARSFHPTPARRRGGGQPKPRWLVHEALHLLAEGHSVRKTADELNRLHAHAGLTVSRSTVHDWRKRHNARAEAVRCATRHRFPEFETANLRWGLDGTGKVDAQGCLHFILGIIDHGTRALLGLRVVDRPSSWVILAHLFMAIDRFGKPESIRTDNASVFKKAAFTAVLAAVGIRHECIAVACPWQNERVERLFLTLKEKLNLIVPTSGATLNQLLGDFRTWYNDIRPHQHLHGFTPSEVWFAIDPYATAPKEIRRFEAWDGLLQGYHIRR